MTERVKTTEGMKKIHVFTEEVIVLISQTIPFYFRPSQCPYQCGLLPLLLYADISFPLNPFPHITILQQTTYRDKAKFLQMTLHAF